MRVPQPAPTLLWQLSVRRLMLLCLVSAGHCMPNPGRQPALCKRSHMMAIGGWTTSLRTCLQRQTKGRLQEWMLFWCRRVTNSVTKGPDSDALRLRIVAPEANVIPQLIILLGSQGRKTMLSMHKSCPNVYTKKGKDIAYMCALLRNIISLCADIKAQAAAAHALANLTAYRSGSCEACSKAQRIGNFAPFGQQRGQVRNAGIRCRKLMPCQPVNGLRESTKLWWTCSGLGNLYVYVGRGLLSEARCTHDCRGTRGLLECRKTPQDTCCPKTIWSMRMLQEPYVTCEKPPCPDS